MLLVANVLWKIIFLQHNELGDLKYSDSPITLHFGLENINCWSGDLLVIPHDNELAKWDSINFYTFIIYISHRMDSVLHTDVINYHALPHYRFMTHLTH